MTPAADSATAGRWLVVCGLVSLLGYLRLAFLPTSNRLEHVLAFLSLLAALAVLGAIGFRLALACSRRLVVGVGFLFAAAFRLALVPAGLPSEGFVAAVADDARSRAVVYERFLLYDNDTWRYLWDGHVVLHGASPWRTSPGDFDPELRQGPLAESIWRDVWGYVDFRSHRSVYPPLTQALFAVQVALAGTSLVAWKLLLTGIDLLLVWGLFRSLAAAGSPPAWGLLYAWNPVVVKELAGSGHVDGWMMLWCVVTVLLLARGRTASAGAALAAATLAKLAALPLAVLFVRRDRWRGLGMLAGLLAVTAAFFRRDLGAYFGAFQAYWSQWRFNSGVWELLAGTASWLGAAEPQLWADLVTKAGLAAVAFAIWRRERQPTLTSLARAAFWLLAVLALTSPAVMPWYLLWAAPFAALAGVVSWYPVTVLSLASYLVYAGLGEVLWWRVAEHVLIALLLLWELRRGAQPPICMKLARLP